MQALAARQSSRVAVARSARSSRVANVRVVCQASKPVEAVKKAAAAAAGLPALLAAHPAFALVDDRLNGDGTGLPLGINDGALSWALFGVATVTWAVWFISQRELGDFEDKDSGLNL
mmetsp:Transcript_31174/g.69333  ORF Transcript_31174/g.69333 Transcript_31174/m.69333 type:complete len:117 (+) Transcript_31174:75-425(+)|eukprot:CAMPEP_0202898444 /NCGR_PEP_ID=MMETSP1392-20130828/6952_1 /ASSEMBLY_ACC=CAM_ASM_000868 /TAXON_ID=225041 /ORGANISM="Chlamydomonas chlamydogama, Strain SAG 11-48b" /LENGTH=116 /DNA_ID=CAMNT_0049584377 /DNA_START=81 /DNA_END=431 /DNA_ORIENTATION=-